MENTHYILILDDDKDDLDLCMEARSRMKLDVDFICFSDGPSLIKFLKNATKAPVFILSDLNMPSLNGFELRKKMIQDPDLHYKSVPFIFWSTSASEQQIKQAYDALTQGFFDKPSTMKELSHLLSQLINYWLLSRHPKKI